MSGSLKVGSRNISSFDRIIPPICQMNIFAWSIGREDPIKRVRELATLSKYSYRVIGSCDFSITQLRLKQKVSELVLKWLTNHSCDLDSLNYGWNRLARKKFIGLLEAPEGFFDMFRTTQKIYNLRFQKILDWVRALSAKEASLISRFDFSSDIAFGVKNICTVLNACPNVVDLTLDASVIPTSQIAFIVQKAPKITHLKLSCSFGAEDTIFSALLPYASQIQSLDVTSYSSNRTESSIHIHNFMQVATNICSLKLNRGSISPWLETCLINNPHLRELSLLNGKLSDDLCVAIAPQCSRLNSLSIDIQEPLTSLGFTSILRECQLLTHLTLYHKFRLMTHLSCDSQILDVIQEAHSLTSLKIDFDGSLRKESRHVLPFTSEQLERLKKLRPNLKVEYRFPEFYTPAPQQEPEPVEWIGA